MNITFYQFVKRENSTAQPGAGVTSKTYDCKLKEDTSIIEPSILIVKEAAQSYTDLLAYNYAYIADFGRYYFVRNVISVSNVMVEFILEVDSLASFKSEVGSANEYVLRSASSYDGDIVDNLYPCKAECTLDECDNSAGGGGPGQPETGTFNTSNITYIVGILNNSTGDKFGAVKYYALTDTQLTALMQYLLGNDILTDTQTLINNLSTELQNGIARSLMNPTDFIVESYAIPYKPLTGALETIKIGWWTTDLTGYPVDSDTANYWKTVNSGSLSFTDHPQKASRGAYLNTAPYTRYWLYAGVFGTVPIDTMKALADDHVSYQIEGDPFGNVKCKLSIGSTIVEVLSANVKCNFPIGQVSVDALGGASSMVSAVMQVSSANYDSSESVAGGYVSGANGIANSVKAMLPQSRVSGSTGTFVDCFKAMRLYIETHEVVDDDLAQRGRPLCQKVQISSLSGYILVSDPDIAISGTAEENTRIKSYMASGFFYE